MNNNTMGIYIHIPFCVKKCNYCDFLSFPVNEETKPIYTDALVKEIYAYGKLYGKNGTITPTAISTLFFGGGTPSIMESKYIHSIMKALRDSFNFTDNAEITIETNPGTLNLLKLSDYKYMGINRLSIGLQSANDNELKSLGRIHTYTSFKESFKDARKAGFDNINIDIMSALPGQTFESYTDTLNKVLSFEPEHISAYSLIIEENTPFFDIYDDYRPSCGFAPLPDEDTEREMYYKTDELLKSRGYYRYEISNYSHTGRECIHNLGYWKRKNYLGLGLGASSFINGVRFKNISDIKEYILVTENLSKADNISTSLPYINTMTEDITYLSEDDAMSEFMFLGLRTIKGIDKSDFYKQFKKDIYNIYGVQLEKFKKENLISDNGSTISLTEKGIDVSNYIFSDFIL